jgi:hypothetical protein
MLNISPFTYGMTVVQIYDRGNSFSPSVLDVDESELVDRFLSGIKTIAAISLALKYPTIVSVSHVLVNAYKNLLAVSLATDYTFDGSEKVCNFNSFLWKDLSKPCDCRSRNTSLTPRPLPLLPLLLRTPLRPLPLPLRRRKKRRKSLTMIW